jgi:hypothetical protein
VQSATHCDNIREQLWATCGNCATDWDDNIRVQPIRTTRQQRTHLQQRLCVTCATHRYSKRLAHCANLTNDWGAKMMDFFVLLMFLIGCATTLIGVVIFILWWFTFRGTKNGK